MAKSFAYADIAVEIQKTNESGEVSSNRVHLGDYVSDIECYDSSNGTKQTISGMLVNMKIMPKTSYNNAGSLNYRNSGAVIDGVSVSTNKTLFTSVDKSFEIPQITIKDTVEGSHKFWYIQTNNIISIGENYPINFVVDPDTDDLVTTLNEVPDGAFIDITNSPAVADSLNITKGVTLMGEFAGVPQNTKSTNMARGPVDGSLTAAVEIDAAGKEVVFDGVVFANNAFPVIKSAAKVVFKNCRFENMIPNAAKTMQIAATAKEEFIMKVEGCYFGNTPNSGSNKLYHNIDFYTLLATGSVVSNNYFEKGCCTHNNISLYGIADDAVVEISNNVCEYSANMVRIGFIGAPKGSVIMKNNTCVEVEEGDWAGMILIQPYGKQTSTFENLKIAMNGTKCPGTQIGYYYCGKSDTQLSESQLAKITIDGTAGTLPMRH